MKLKLSSSLILRSSAAEVHFFKLFNYISFWCYLEDGDSVYS